MSDMPGDPSLDATLALARNPYGYIEVRRFYPFFPFVGARVRKDFQWRGFDFPEGRRTILDLYGTNHGPRTWQDPLEFRPERFASWDGCPFNFIPQGGGDPDGNHRCPGERIVIDQVKVALRFLVEKLSYELPDQNLTLDTSRMPALPRSRIIISRVKLRD
jgi:fatty-acid peroxygenase